MPAPWSNLWPITRSTSTFGIGAENLRQPVCRDPRCNWKANNVAIKLTQPHQSTPRRKRIELRVDPEVTGGVCGERANSGMAGEVPPEDFGEWQARGRVKAERRKLRHASTSGWRKDDTVEVDAPVLLPHRWPIDNREYRTRLR